MELGDKIRVCLYSGGIKYSAVIKENVPCGDGAVGSWGVAVVKPDIWKEGILTERHKSWFNGFFYDYWVVLLDNGRLIRITG